MLKLNAREIPLVNFRASLPSFLSGGGECYIEVDARAGGAINTEFAAAAEQLALKARVMDRKTEKLASDDEAYVHSRNRAVLAVVRDRFGVIYDTCITGWRTNILSDGKVLSCDRETFLALLDQRVPEIAAAFADLEKEIIKAGQAVAEDDKATLKN